MQIYWDHFGFREQHGGIAVYAEQMQRGFASQGIAPKPVVLAEASSLWPKSLLSKKPVWLSWLALSWFPKHFDQNTEAVFHGLANFDIPLISARRFPNVKLFLTVHDLIPLLLPKASPLKWQMEWLMPERLQRADGIVCVSEWAKHTLVEKFPRQVANQRIVVLPHGIDPSERKRRKNRSQSEERKILMVSRLESYKGFEVVFQLLERTKSSDLFTIVTDGKGVAFVNQFLQKNAKLAPRVVVKTGLKRHELLELYDVHDVLLQPSWFEGFGFPVQEALLRGCRALYRAGSAMDDFGVGAGLQCVTRDAKIDEWVSALETLLSQREDERVNEWLYEKAGSFLSWQETCHKLFTFYTLQNGPTRLQ